LINQLAKHPRLMHGEKRIKHGFKFCQLLCHELAIKRGILSQR
jgi:hypothetical protein